MAGFQVTAEGIGAAENLQASLHFRKLSSMDVAGRDVGEITNAAIGEVQDYERHLVRRIQICFVRAVSCELRSAFVLAGQDAVTKVRIPRIKEEINSLSGELGRFESKLRDKVPELKGSWLTLKSTNRKHQLKLNEQAEDTVAKGRDLIKEMLGGLSFAEQSIIARAGSDISVCIDIDDQGNLTGMRGTTQGTTPVDHLTAP